MREFVVVITHKRAILLLTSAAVCLLSIGIALIITSSGSDRCELKYAVNPPHSATLVFSSKNCPKLQSPLTGKYALYYKLNGYYQNHKDFRRSVEYSQLLGKIYDSSTSVSNCSPYMTDNDGKVLHPCGALAHHIFQDRFTVFRDKEKTREIELDESRKAICNRWGVHTLFNNPSDEEIDKHSNLVNFWMRSPEVRKHLSMDKPGVGEGVTNSHFINWVDISSTSAVQKLYGILHAESVPLPIYVNVDVSTSLPRVVTKSVVIEKTTTLGRIGRVMGIMYVTVSVLIAILSFMAFVNWRKQPPGRMK